MGRLRKFCCIWLSALLLGAASSAWAFSGAGAGTSGDPYEITSCDQLQEMTDELTAHYVLSNDIDCTQSSTWNAGAGYIPAGTSGSRFTGSLNGQNFSISNLFINRGSTDYIGLFGYTNSAQIRNVHLVNVTITGRNQVGSLVGMDSAGSSIENCSSSGTLNAATNGAGLGGYMVGTVARSVFSTVDVNATAGNYVFAGLFGALTGGGSVTDCFASGEITTTNSYYTAGLIGDLDDTNTPGSGVFNCYASGNVTSSSHSIGGLIGNFGSGFGGVDVTVVQNSYARGTVTGGSSEGGLVGNRGSGIVQGSFFDAVASTQGSCVGAGGTGSGGSCTAVNTGGTPDADYFLANKTNGPFASWDFSDVWQICPGSDPMFQGLCTATITGASVLPENLTANATGDVNVQFTATNTIADDGKILLTFPTGFDLHAGGTTTLTSPVNIDGEFTLSTNGQLLTISRSAGSDVQGGTAISFTLSNIKNPSSSGATGTFSLQTATSAVVVLDEDAAVDSVSLECAAGTYGISCAECPGGSSNACSGHGSCDDGSSGSGICTCADGFSGTDCKSCDPGRYGEACSVCPGSGNCSGNGSCNDGISGDGSCDCNAGFQGTDCSERATLERPTLKKKIRRRRGVVKFTCETVDAGDSSRYKFYVRTAGRKGKRIVTRKRKNMKVKLDSTLRRSVQCRHITDELKSRKSKRKRM